MHDSTNVQNLIREKMPVVCSENGQFAVVDHMEGCEVIKLAKDADGQHHYIPLTWVSSVDDKVHIDRPGDQAMKEWSSTPPADAKTDAKTDAKDGGAPHHVNSVDATMGQPIVSRVMTRKHELEALQAGLPADDVRVRGEIDLALSTVNELLTGDLSHVPAVVAADLSSWLERHKHLAESAVDAPVAAPSIS